MEKYWIKMDLSIFKCVLYVVSLIIVQAVNGFQDKECEPWELSSHATVCICNATYCDTITREPPAKDSYVVYSSTATGERFKKSFFRMAPREHQQWWQYSIEVDPTVTYQTIEGFGGAVTDAAAINWHSLQDPTLKKHFVDSYFGSTGIGYTMLRVPIGGSDFSARPYTYNELPVDDYQLTNFTLSTEDHDYKIPFIKECQKASKKDLHVIATTWSPPKWMKDSKKLMGYSRLRGDCYQAYADYHVKFIQLYKEQGIPIWGITTTNEPTIGLLNTALINSLGWTVRGMGKWIQDNLGPTMRKNCPEVKIIGVDDQRFLVPLWFNILVSETPEALNFLDGVAVHYYFDKITPASMLKTSMLAFPDKFVIATEASEGGNANTTVDLGSWERAENYALDIIEDLSNDVIGWLDFNLALDMTGGPSWVENFVDSAVIVDEELGEFYKQPMFYAIGHFSKFVPRGSKRVKIAERNFAGPPVKHVGFLTPEDTVVVVFCNEGGERSIIINLYNKQCNITLKEKSITTVELSYDSKKPRVTQQTSSEEIASQESESHQAV